jgi:hypothetical protein
MSSSMESAIPCLDRLLEACARHGIPVDIQPPGRAPPKAGELVAGFPLDPVLARIYARAGSIAFGGRLEGIHLYRLDDQANHLAEENEERRRRWPEALRSALFLFAHEPALAYYLATVPKLAAGAERRQPVVQVDTYEDPYALPVASNVDRFFDTYSLYLERQQECAHSAAEATRGISPGTLLEGASDVVGQLVFPWHVPDLIAQDQPLVEMLRAGRFDFLMGTSEDVRRWVGQVLAASP